MSEDIELGASMRSRWHVIIHPQPPKPLSGKLPFYAQYAACGMWLHGLATNYWTNPADALSNQSLSCKGCRRYLRDESRAT